MARLLRLFWYWSILFYFQRNLQNTRKKRQRFYASLYVNGTWSFLSLTQKQWYFTLCLKGNRPAWNISLTRWFYLIALSSKRFKHLWCTHSLSGTCSCCTSLPCADLPGISHTTHTIPSINTNLYILICRNNISQPNSVSKTFSKKRRWTNLLTDGGKHFGRNIILLCKSNVALRK